MTEAEWLATADPDVIHRPLPPPDHQQMLKHVADRYGALRKRRLGDRKLRLFACECCRRHWELLSHAGRAAVLQAEEFAEGRSSRRELMAVRRTANAAGMGVDGIPVYMKWAAVTCWWRQEFCHSRMDGHALR